ncbi:hypothetical protein, partial [Vibrio cholerae]|uniref:hypothetical protein n=1 Tax=Vibrio cholerae TaxID=666 RepID=UPI000A25F74A
MDSFTITFTGVEPELRSIFFPPIELNGNYVIGLVDFQSYNSIFNVKKPFNTLTYYKVQKLITPKGKVSIDALNIALQDKIKIMVNDDEMLTKINTKVVTYKGLMLKLNKHKGKNITLEEGDDLFYYDVKSKNVIEIPEGTYEVFELAKEVQKQIPDFVLLADNKTMKATLTCSHVFDFTKPCLGSVLLGFKG